jgi:hypothetical protein
VSQSRASCALYLRGNVPPSLFFFFLNRDCTLEVATSTIRRAWARPSVCRKPSKDQQKSSGGRGSAGAPAAMF